MPSKTNDTTLHATIIFADGACSGNPGPGGWAAVIATPDGKVVELGGRDPDTTNNKMELTAVGKALRYLESTDGPVHVYTDSTYVILGITKWIWGWQKRGWKNAEGEDVANVEYWKRLSALVIGRKNRGGVEWKYVRGHSGVPGNERVDQIAVMFSKNERPRLFEGSLLKYDVAIYDVPENTDVPEMRKREPARAAYSYLSFVGGTARRHATWSECERYVKGVSGAKFKKSTSADEEAEILAGWGVSAADLEK